MAQRAVHISFLFHRALIWDHSFGGYGRSEKVIYPVRKKAMRWEGVDGEKVFAKKVRLRAVAGKHILEHARDRVYQRIRRQTV